VVRYNLACQQLYEKNRTEFVETFKEIPSYSTSLCLYYNSLGLKTGAELAEAFKLIPASVTSLDLTENYLAQGKTSAELAEAFKALPRGIISLNLSNNLLLRIPSAELDEILNALPANVKLVVIDSKIINLNKKRAKQEQQSNQGEEKTLSNLDFQLLVLEAKKTELGYRGFYKASDAAATLHTTLIELKDQYARGTINYPDYKKQSITAIDTARIELGKHRGWKEILGNIASCILGLGIGYAVVCAFKGRFFKFNTDADNKLDEIQKTIEGAAPAA
jgi:hypothetical protein